MTKKDYVLIAKAIYDTQNGFQLKNGKCREGVKATAVFIAQALQGENPRFDWSRFMTACGF